jgi:heme oxygenase
MEPSRPAPAAGLAARLRRETAALHGAAERSPLMAALIAGTIEREAYVALLANLLPLYRTLESALAQRRDDARLAFACAPHLSRSARIEQDLQVLAAGRRLPPTAPAARAYVERLAQLAQTEPLRLLAHAYVRYLGDLYGGQQLARTLRSCLDLAGADGTRFYDFGPPASLPAQRAAFRAGLDALPHQGADAEALVAEARDAFERHIALFAELHARRRTEPDASR